MGRQTTLHTTINHLFRAHHFMSQRIVSHVKKRNSVHTDRRYYRENQLHLQFAAPLTLLPFEKTYSDASFLDPSLSFQIS